MDGVSDGPGWLGSLADAGGTLGLAAGFLERGGPAMWAIAALSVFAVALIFWKFASFLAGGVWRRARAEAAVAAWLAGEDARAAETASRSASACARLVTTAIGAARDPLRSREEAAAETTRIAKRLLGDAQTGLRGLEAISTIAPLLGLFGTVLGMISAFQGLETAGARADAAELAGGIWEALLTTAAGMAVAIPAAAALSWYEGVLDRLRRDMEDMAGRVLNRPRGEPAAAPVTAIGEAARRAEAAE